MSSLVNGFGLYFALSASVGHFIKLGLPYLIGRLYYCDEGGQRELAIGILIGSLIYVPLCLYEIRMSPSLHLNLYGYFHTDFAATRRGGGFRPGPLPADALAKLEGIWAAL